MSFQLHDVLIQGFRALGFRISRSGVNYQPLPECFASLDLLGRSWPT